jgi:hypothetical protein
MITNFRSIYNKVENFKTFLEEVSPDCTIACETWDYEGRRQSLEDLLAGTGYRVLAYRRKGGRRGGSCAIVYNEIKFTVEEIKVDTEVEIESVWALMTPRNLDHALQRVKRICIGSVYIAPRSSMKQATMDHIIQTIHTVRAKYDNCVHFAIGGDVNKTNYDDILDSYGALKQCVTVNTRKGASLTMIRSDLHSLYHPPTTQAPLQVDEEKTGKDSDHDIIIFAQKSDTKFKVIRKKKTVKTRPLPDSKIPLFGRDIQAQSWHGVLNEDNVKKKPLNLTKIKIYKSKKKYQEKTKKKTLKKKN